MNIPTKYGFGSTPKADNKIRIRVVQTIFSFFVLFFWLLLV